MGYAVCTEFVPFLTGSHLKDCNEWGLRDVDGLCSSYSSFMFLLFPLRYRHDQILAVNHQVPTIWNGCISARNPVFAASSVAEIRGTWPSFLGTWRYKLDLESKWCVDRCRPALSIQCPSSKVSKAHQMIEDIHHSQHSSCFGGRHGHRGHPAIASKSIHHGWNALPAGLRAARGCQV